MKNILIINAHPNNTSLCNALANSYYNGANKNATVCNLVNLANLKFDPNLHYGYTQRTELEPDLINMQTLITNANHIVFVYPTWWGTYPALLKGFFDRVFLPKYAFKYRQNSLLWDKLLKGKTARIIVTMDTPTWYYALVYKNAGHNSIKKCILQFCGINKVKFTALGPVKTSTLQKREAWLSKVYKLGQQLK